MFMLQGYRPSAQRASILFFVLNDMGRIDPMYQFSLDAYIELFLMSIDKSQRSSKLDERIANLNDYHTYAVYRSVVCLTATCIVKPSFYTMANAVGYCVGVYPCVDRFWISLGRRMKSKNWIHNCNNMILWLNSIMLFHCCLW